MLFSDNSSMRGKYTIKQILLSNQNWWKFYQKHKHSLREAIPIAVAKLLSCKHVVRGRQTYQCSNPQCPHTKYVNHTCKSRACSSCGKKATAIWIEQQKKILPQTTWQHITFTIPRELWDFFWLNRHLLHLIAKIAADCIKKIAANKNIVPGIFIAIHTFGRDLKRNVHIHLSTTLGGITKDGQQWKAFFIKHENLMRMWRYRIVKLLRNAFNDGKLIIPNALKQQMNKIFSFNQFLDILYNKHWVVHCAKPSKDNKHNINYLGRYIKRPAIAESKLKHYDGNEVAFKYLHHSTKTYRRFSLSVEDFIGRFVQHIPDVGFRMIRYYGFLAHRVRGTMLPLVYQLLKQEQEYLPKSPCYAELMEQNFGVNPLKCILCGAQMLLSAITFGITNTLQLLNMHHQLATLKIG